MTRAQTTPMPASETTASTSSKHTPIPNIVIGEDYDKKFAHAPIHYDSLDNLASFFGRKMQIHRHTQYWQIHFIENGQTHFHIDDREFHVNGACCFVTPAAVPHSFQISEDAVGHVVTINQSLVWELGNDHVFKNLQLGESGFCITQLNCPAELAHNWQLLKQTLFNIKQEWEKDAQGKHLIIRAFAQILLMTLLRLSPSTNRGQIVDDEDLRIFRKFSDLIEAHFAEHWNLQNYTQALGVSENRLNQISQRICYNSPKRLINERILQEARRLLLHTSASCNTISYNLGFSDPAYFARFFKKHTGKTAQNYRKIETSKQF